MVRLFVALPLCPEAREGLARFLARTAEVGDGVKWTAGDQLHVTLKFLGEQPSAKVEVLATAVGRAAGRAAPFPFTVGGLGGFPDLRRPRVLWAGIGLGVAEMAGLAALLEEELAPLGVPGETRPFRAHVTLGRPRHFERGRASRRGGHGPGPAPLAGRIAKAFQDREGEPFGRCHAEEVHLMESVLTPQGARHSLRADARLGGG